MSKSYRNVDFVTNGWSNYTPAGPMGNQFSSPYGDPYRVQGVNGFFSAIGSGIANIGSGIGKIVTPLLPVAVPLAGTAVSALLTDKPSTPSQAPAQSQFTVAVGQAAAQQAQADAEKSNQTVYLIAGGVTLFALFYFLSRRK